MKKFDPNQPPPTEYFEHLLYEIEMLLGLYPELSREEYNQTVHNALVEAFCLHARILIEFFQAEQVHPKCFTEGSYEPKDTFEHKTQINTQIAHLTKRRTSVPSNQLGEKEWKLINDTLEQEISLFEMALKPEYKSKWGSRLKSVKDLTIITQGAKGPTNSISVTRTEESIMGRIGERIDTENMT